MFERIIIERLMDGIESGEYEDEGRLPSENEVSARYRVPRLVARRALVSLEEMGYAEAKKGKGRFLRKRGEAFSLDMRGDVSFSVKLKAAGRTLRTVVAIGGQVGPAHPSRAALGLGPEVPVLEASRLRIVDGEPIAIHYSYVDESRFPDARERMRACSSMFDYFRDRGFPELESGPSRLSACLPRSEEQELLACPPLVPLIALDSSTLDAVSGAVLQATRTLYRGDCFFCLIDSSPVPRHS
jgi:GntR family transcriptional regulator